jgi:hypothetical protein
MKKDPEPLSQTARIHPQGVEKGQAGDTTRWTQRWVMTFPHSGIRIDRIPAEGGGGLIFAIGMATLALLAFPALLPVAGAAALGGVVLAPILHRLYR